MRKYEESYFPAYNNNVSLVRFADIYGYQPIDCCDEYVGDFNIFEINYESQTYDVIKYTYIENILELTSCIHYIITINNLYVCHVDIDDTKIEFFTSEQFDDCHYISNDDKYKIASCITDFYVDSK